MKAYIAENKKKIEPFDEYPRDCLIENKSLITIQGESLSALGLKPGSISNPREVEDSDEYIIFNDGLYFSQELLKEFVARSKIQRSCTVCALKNGVTTLRTVTSTQDVKIGADRTEYDLYYFPKKELRGVCHPLLIEPDNIGFGIPMPQHMCESKKYSIPITEKYIIQINHWVNLWVANIISVLSEGARLQKKPKITLAILALKAASFNKWKILRQLNKIGSNCDIHPTAYIEGSTIGDNVAIGAGTTIRQSVIGKGAFIGNGVVVEESVIGENNTILNGHIMFSVLYPGTFSFTNILSTSLIGRDTFIGGGVILSDFRFDGKSVSVMKNGNKVDTKNTFIGVCLGHGVYLGAGCIVAPGRMIQSGIRITPERERIIHKSNQNMPGFRSIKS